MEPVDFSPDPMKETHIFYSEDRVGISRPTNGGLSRSGISQETNGYGGSSGVADGVSEGSFGDSVARSGEVF